MVQVRFVDYWYGRFPFNDLFSEQNHKAHGDYDYAEYLDRCAVSFEVYDAILELNPCSNIYEVNTQCLLIYDPLRFVGGSSYMALGAPTVYFKHTEVKQALHIPVDTDCEIYNNGVFPCGDRPTGSSVVQIPKAIDKTENVQIHHGNFNIVLLMNQILL